LIKSNNLLLQIAWVISKLKFSLTLIKKTLRTSQEELVRPARGIRGHTRRQSGHASPYLFYKQGCQWVEYPARHRLRLFFNESRFECNFPLLFYFSSYSLLKKSFIVKLFIYSYSCINSALIFLIIFFYIMYCISPS